MPVPDRGCGSSACRRPRNSARNRRWWRLRRRRGRRRDRRPRARGWRMPTRHGAAAGLRAQARTSPPRFTRPCAMPCSRQIVAARSAAYSLPMPPKSISMPARGRRTAASLHSTSRPPDQRPRPRARRRGHASAASRAEVPHAAQHARGDVEQAAALLRGTGRRSEQRGGLGVDRNRRAARCAVDARGDAVVAIARVLRLDARTRRSPASAARRARGSRRAQLVLRGHARKVKREGSLGESTRAPNRRRRACFQLKNFLVKFNWNQRAEKTWMSGLPRRRSASRDPGGSSRRAAKRSSRPQQLGAVSPR